MSSLFSVQIYFPIKKINHSTSLNSEEEKDNKCFKWNMLIASLTVLILIQFQHSWNKTHNKIVICISQNLLEAYRKWISLELVYRWYHCKLWTIIHFLLRYPAANLFLGKTIIIIHQTSNLSQLPQKCHGFSQECQWVRWMRRYVC